MKPSIRTIVLIWLAWVFILIGFQALVSARFQPERPDRVLFWTDTETTAAAQNDQPYLMLNLLSNLEKESIKNSLMQ